MTINFKHNYCDSKLFAEVEKFIPLGVESGRIGMGQIFSKMGTVGTATYSSEEGARLNRPTIGPMLNYWIPKADFLVVDLILVHEITAIATQGGEEGSVGSAGVSYSEDMNTWIPFNTDETATTFEVR